MTRRHGAIHSQIPGVAPLSRYTRAGNLAPPPASVDWWSAVKEWPLYRNDQLEDCGAAMVAHQITAWTAVAGAPLVMPEPQVIALYSELSGYVPGQESTDTGTSFAVLLPYWAAGQVNTGVDGHFGDKLDAYCKVDFHSLDEVRWATAWFGGVLGLWELPKSIDGQAVWDVPPGGLVGDGAPGSRGLHFAPIVGYDAGGFVIVTWGAVQRATPAFVTTYLGDAYAAVSRDFLTAAGTTPEGLSVDQMVADMKGVG